MFSSEYQGKAVSFDGRNENKTNPTTGVEIVDKTGIAPAIVFRPAAYICSASLIKPLCVWRRALRDSILFFMRPSTPLLSCFGFSHLPTP